MYNVKITRECLTQELKISYYQRFKIRKEDGKKVFDQDFIFYFSDEYILQEESNTLTRAQLNVLTLMISRGFYKLIKYGIKPSENSSYYYCLEEGKVSKGTWSNSLFDLSMYYSGLVCESKEKALLSYKQNYERLLDLYKINH